MATDLIPWLILWAVITTAVLVLAVWRLMVARVEKQVAGIHIAAGEEAIPEVQTKVATKLARIDFWGQMLTVISAVLVLAIGAIWLYRGWLKSYETFR